MNHPLCIPLRSFAEVPKSANIENRGETGYFTHRGVWHHVREFFTADAAADVCGISRIQTADDEVSFFVRAGKPPMAKRVDTRQLRIVKRASLSA